MINDEKNTFCPAMLPYSNAIASPGCVFLGTRHNVTTPVCFKVILASRLFHTTSCTLCKNSRTEEAGLPLSTSEVSKSSSLGASWKASEHARRQYRGGFRPWVFLLATRVRQKESGGGFCSGGRVSSHWAASRQSAGIVPEVAFDFSSEGWMVCRIRPLISKLFSRRGSPRGNWYFMKTDSH
ncbi:HET-domain-containing protein, partial [Aureobasidium melanogenum]